MKLNSKINTLFLGLLISSFSFANQSNNDVDEKACLDNEACPKILEYSLPNQLKKNEDFRQSAIVETRVRIINRSSKRGVTTVPMYQHGNSRGVCTPSSIYLNPKETKEINISCDTPGTPFSIFDSEGRSNVLPVLTVPDSSSCKGKSIGDECSGGVLYYINGSEGKVVTLERDLNKSVAWGSAADGCQSSLISGLGDNGQTNSQIISNLCPNSAANYCVNLKNPAGGWYLPALLSLSSAAFAGSEMGQLINAINSNATVANISGLSSFLNLPMLDPSVYIIWSSNQNDAISANAYATTLLSLFPPPFNSFSPSYAAIEKSATMADFLPGTIGWIGAACIKDVAI